MGVLRLRADLHNHSCLSPCADLSMSPRAMAEAASARGVDILGLTDHNASLNCPAFALACARAGIIPLFGLEMNSSEEVHILALFASPRAALAFGAEIQALLPELPWDPATFGDQVVVDDSENVLELHGRWLGAALDAPFGELAEKARLAGALVIPAHVDRGMFSVYSQLGFLPPGPYDAVEAMGPLPAYLSGGFGVISGSDAHYPEHVGRRPTLIDVEGGGVPALLAALAGYAKACSSAGAPTDAPSSAPVAIPVGAPDSELASDEQKPFGGYAELLEDPRLGLYPEAEAARFMECLRDSLRAGKVEPTLLPRPLVP